MKMRAGIGGRVASILRSGLCLGLLAATSLLVSLVGTPAWAPEDPWRSAGATPLAGPASPEKALMVAEFLGRHDVDLPPALMFDVAQSVAQASQEHGLDPRLLLSVILSESRFRTAAVSHKGAVGLMQLLPSTAAAVAARLDIDADTQACLLDTRTNIAMGTYYLHYLLDLFNDDLGLALTAYNRGPGFVRSMLASGTADAAADLTSSYAEGIVQRLGDAGGHGGHGDWHLASRDRRPSLGARSL